MVRYPLFAKKWGGTFREELGKRINCIKLEQMMSRRLRHEKDMSVFQQVAI